MNAEPCLWCAEESTLLCDYMLGYSRREDDGTAICAEGFTCDAPMCPAHAERIGHVNMGDDPHDSIDVCHAHRGKGTGVHLPGGARNREQADVARRAVRVQAARSRIGLVRT